MLIPTISAPILAYLRTFDLTAVVLTRDCRWTATQDPSGRDAESVWWARAVDIGKLVTAARKTGDIQAAAKRLGVRITAHDTVLQRAQAALAKIDERLGAAHADGDLGFFNTAYRTRRLQAQANGATLSHTAQRDRACGRR